MKRLIILTILLSLPSYSFAQETESALRVYSELFGAANLWIALLGGVILAIGFAVLLTNLAIATGLSIFNVENSLASHPNSTSGPDDDNSGNVMRKITGAFGAYTLVTTTIALFFAVWLATELSQTLSVKVGAVLGLMIWGLFFLILAIFEVSAIFSLAGLLITTAKTGVKSAYDSVSSIFSKSQEDKFSDLAADVTASVKDELLADLDTDDLKGQIQQYVDQLQHPEIEFSAIRKEIEKILEKIEVDAIINEKEGNFTEEEVKASLKLKSGITGDEISKITNHLNDAVQKYKTEKQKDKHAVSQASDAIMRSTGLTAEEAQNYRNKIEELLRSTEKEELDPDELKDDLEKLFTDPETGKENLQNKLSSIDRNFIADVIAEKSDLSKEEVNAKIDKVYSVIEGLKQKYADKSSAVQQKSPAPADKASEVKNKLLTSLQTYLDSLDRPELDYEGVERDVKKLFSDPKAGSDAILKRLKSMDRETLKAVVASRKDMDEADAERLVTRMETSRDDMIRKYEEVKLETEKRLKELRQTAIHQAEEVRRTTAAAAWWAFGTALVSGGASALAGILGSGF